jgi:hypothetical protein
MTGEKAAVRLRAIIRENRQMLKRAVTIDYGNLFELWADFDDAEAPKEVIRLCESNGLGDIDAISFMAFCYGYEKAVRKIRENL